MSGNAAKEIGSMLEASVQKVHSIVAETRASVEQLIRDGKSKVLAGAKVADICAEALEEIVGAVSEVKENVVQITGAAAEQAKGVSEITIAMQRLALSNFDPVFFDVRKSSNHEFWGQA